MAYTTLAAVKQMFGTAQINELVTGNAATSNDTVAQAALDRAESFAKGYVTVRWPKAFVTVPPELAQHTGEIARFNMCKGKVPDFIQRKYDIAWTWLKDIAAGRATMSVDTTDTEDEGSVQYTESNRAFANGELDVF